MKELREAMNMTDSFITSQLNYYCYKTALLPAEELFMKITKCYPTR